MEWFEIALRWVFGLQMVFWGINGFFHWVIIPPSGDVIQSFSEACIKTRFIMPTVKVLEIGAGALLLAGVAVPLCLILFAPLVFVITGLHIFHNPKPWSVILPISFPYVILLLLYTKNFSEFLRF
ncbi:hypothetical protein D3C87_89490 [compost metagenome]